MGSHWLHLRRCTSCGHVGCCDSSPNRHATAHFRVDLAPDRPELRARRGVALVLRRRDRLRARHRRAQPRPPLTRRTGTPVSNDQAFPTLSDEMIDIARRYGSESTIAAGEFAFVEGQLSYDLVVIVDGSFSILAHDRAADGAERVVTTHGTGRFLGELNILTGERTTLAARAERDSRRDPHRPAVTAPPHGRRDRPVGHPVRGVRGAARGAPWRCRRHGDPHHRLALLGLRAGVALVRPAPPSRPHVHRSRRPGHRRHRRPAHEPRAPPQRHARGDHADGGVAESHGRQPRRAPGGHVSSGRRPGLRRPGGRGGPGRSRRRGLWRLRGPRHARARRRRSGRPGRDEFADRELLRLPGRGVGRRTRRAGSPAGDSTRGDDQRSLHRRRAQPGRRRLRCVARRRHRHPVPRRGDRHRGPVPTVAARPSRRVRRRRCVLRRHRSGGPRAARVSPSPWSAEGTRPGRRRSTWRRAAATSRS